MSEHDDVGGASRLSDDELAALLVDTSLWAEPPASLEGRVVAAVTVEQRGAGSRAGVIRRRRWLVPAVAAVLGAAAAALVAVAAWPDRSAPTQAGPPAGTPVEMTGTDLAPDANGTASVAKLGSGWSIQIRIPELPWRDGKDFYQVWVRDCAKQYLVPAGSFHDLRQVVAWAGVSLDEFPMITVTREQLSGNDAGQQSSGETVATGFLHPCT